MSRGAQHGNVRRDGRDGLITAQTSDFDVLVVDRMLPDLDGLSLVRRLRASERYGDLPVLMLTARTDEAETRPNAGAAFGISLEEYLLPAARRIQLIGEDGTIYKPITTINSEKCAQVMLVMGSDAKYTHPNWRQNLSLAVKIQKEMNTLWPTLARPIGLRENRYSPSSVN